MHLAGRYDTPSHPITRKMHSILIINPNSTQAMTDALQPLIQPLLPATVAATYFTAPPPSPPSINDRETSQKSAEVSLPHVLPLLDEHDAFVVACYSAHPLVPMLRARTPKPVVGIFEASVYHSLALVRPGEEWGIVTTGKVWEELLGEAVRELVGARRFRGVGTSGLNADELHRVPESELRRRMQEAVRGLMARKEERLGVVVLGCAGMVGLGGIVREVVGKGVRIVDGVEAGVKIALGLLETSYDA